MKRLLLIILGLSICLFLSSCSVSETNEQLIDNSNTSQTTNNTNSIAPDDIMYFDSFQHMAQLKKYRENVDDTDNDIVWYEYVTKNYRGGIISKEEVSQMFANLDGLNMLLLDSSSGYNLSSITYRGPEYYGRGIIDYVYTNEDKMIRMKCYVDPDGTVATEFAYRKKYDVADRIGFGDEEIILYYASKEVGYSFCSCITTSNSLMDVWFYDDDISAAKEVIEKYAISTTLNELIA